MRDPSVVLGGWTPPGGSIEAPLTRAPRRQ
jgi:hypothetical protein